MDFDFQFLSHGCRDHVLLSSENDAIFHCEFISVVKVWDDAERDLALVRLQEI